MDVLKEFYAWNPSLVYQMKECSHHYNPPYDLNPYHLEGDCYTHSMMVLNNLEDELVFNILGVCHDIGKIYAHHIKDGKVKFSGHEFASIQDTIDFLYYLRDKGYFSDITEMAYYVLSIISGHMNMLSGDMDIEKKKAVLNHDFDLIEKAEKFSRADKKGCIVDKNAVEKETREIDLGDVDVTKGFVNSMDDCDIILMCGVPGCGKDYLAEKLFPDARILSYDDIRVEVYRNSSEYDGSEEESFHELYYKAYNYARKNKIDLNSYLNQEVDSAFYDGYKKVVICNTNLTRKSRRSTINLLSRDDRKFGAYFILANSDTIFNRNRNRNKVIPEHVMRSFFTNQQIPTQHDGFDRVEFVDNEVK